MRYIKLLSIVFLLVLMGCSDAQTSQSQSSQDSDNYVRTVLNKAGMDVPQHTQVNISRTPEELSTNSAGPSVRMRSDKNYFGWGASAVTAASADKGLQIGKMENPSLSVNPETGAASMGESTFGKTTAGASGGSWFSMLWQTIKDWGVTIGIILLVIVVGGAILYFMVPAAKPIIDAILRALASLFPILGSVVENKVAGKKTIAAESTTTDVVIGINQAKDAVDNFISTTDFTAATFNKETFKTNIRDIINLTLKSEQDQTDEEAVAKIKMANRL